MPKLNVLPTKSAPKCHAIAHSGCVVIADKITPHGSVNITFGQNHRSTMGLGNAFELGQLSDEMLTAGGRLASHLPSFLAYGE